MTDDLSTFWQTNERARTLFYDLLARAERDAYDDDFLALLAAYRQTGGSDVHADIFAAQYLLADGATENAIVCAERACAQHPINRVGWQVLADAHRMCGDVLHAAI